MHSVRHIKTYGYTNGSSQKNETQKGFHWIIKTIMIILPYLPFYWNDSSWLINNSSGSSQIKHAFTHTIDIPLLVYRRLCACVLGSLCIFLCVCACLCVYVSVCLLVCVCATAPGMTLPQQEACCSEQPCRAEMTGRGSEAGLLIGQGVSPHCPWPTSVSATWKAQPLKPLNAVSATKYQALLPQY